jgi:hypothetical protein
MEGVSQYSKIMHDENFKTNTAVSPSPAPAPPVSQDTSGKNSESGDNTIKWIEVPCDKRSGARQAVIEKLRITNKGTSLDVVQKGDQITVQLLVHASSDMEEIIFGYTVKDRVGNAVFGENSLCLDTPPQHLREGYNQVEYTFYWPEISPNNYTITGGIGQGDDPFRHVIQCWAHNIVSLTAIAPGRCIHGMFNNELKSLKISPVSEF